MQGDDNMNNDWRKEYLFQKNFTDDDFEKETDIEKLNLWFQLSLKVSSLEEFEQNM